MKNLIPNYIQKSLVDGDRNGSGDTYAMFIDLSGFTPLTYALMRRGARGAEELSEILNAIFRPLVKVVYAHGGFIPYFAGDSFTAVFPVFDTRIKANNFLATAIEVRSLFSRRSYQFGEFTIGLKIGLAFGEVEWGVVGKERLSYYFRGGAIDRAAYGQTLASNQEIILDDKLRRELTLDAGLLVPAGKGYFRFMSDKTMESAPEAPMPLVELSEDVARRMLPDAVLNYAGEGEFRTVTSLFLSFDGVNTHDELDQFATLVLNTVHDFAGYFKEIEFGDKGGVMVAFFGAPISFENNQDRALECIYTLKEELARQPRFSKVSIRAGLTLGTAFTGIVGAEERCQYAAVGNRVNLAARLMTYAGWGEILVDSEISKSRFFSFKGKGNIKYKGIKGSVATYLLTGRGTKGDSPHTGPMVGRSRELQQLMDPAKRLQQGKTAGISFIYGEAGIGKSRLTFEMRSQLSAKSQLEWYACQTDQILRKPFNPFAFWLNIYFEQSHDEPSAKDKKRFEEKFQRLIASVRLSDSERRQEVERELERTKTVIAALVGLHYPNSLWEQLDARGRYQNTIQAVVNLLLAESLRKPIILNIEDGHWMDDSSEELLFTLLRNVENFPIYVVITSRYHDNGAKPEIVPRVFLDELGIPWTEVNLNILSPESVREMAETTLGGKISEEFYELLIRSTNSNPFYLQQLLEYFSESRILMFEDGQWTIKDKNIKLTNSISAILTARIDRLSRQVKETVKAAAVIGREFEVPVLSEVMKVNDAFTQQAEPVDKLVAEKIAEAKQGRIWLALNEQRYIFRHSLLREAAYNMQMQARLRQIHLLIAEAIERIHANQMEERYVDLAFHFDRAGVEQKTCFYLEKSAGHARENYQNRQALEFYSRLLEKLARREEPERQIKAHLDCGHVQELIGEWDDSERSYRQALKLAESVKSPGLQATSLNDLGRLQLLKGDYQHARENLQRAAGIYRAHNDPDGLMEVSGNLGNLYFRQGRYGEARANFLESIGQSTDINRVDPQIVANLGLTYMNEGDFDEGIRFQEEHLKRYRQQNDKQGMAILYTYLGIVYFEKGDYDLALERFEKGLEICQELGNKQLNAIATGNIGLIYERRGEYDKAMAHYETDLELCEELGDKQGTAIALGLIGHLLNIQGEFHRAIEYLQKDLMLCEELGYQKGIAKAVNTLGDVFYFTGQYQRSLHFYDRAIEVTRMIGNKLVLGFSLVEKAAVLIKLKDLEALRKVGDEALELARQLGNPDLLFEAELLSARILELQNQPAKASQILQRLSEQHTSLDQQAAALFELARIHNSDTPYRERARKLYSQLYAETPRYVYKQRVEQLDKSFAKE